jgi:Kef-type K+ transport system membrane component KefB
MSLSNSDLIHLILALLLLLTAAHGLGLLFARLHQPRVAGEIIGGLLLGPTLFGVLSSSTQSSIFAEGKATLPGLGIVYQLGVLFLMYISGAELRSILNRRDRKVTVGIALLGNAVPFVVGLAFLALYSTDRFLGTAHNRTSFLLIFALAMAVTSIPVISRIMGDLGILDTRFARIVLSVAVLEDLLIYVVLNVAIGMVSSGKTAAWTLPSIIGFKPDGVFGSAYYIVLTLVFFLLPRLLGDDFVQRFRHARVNILRGNPIAFQLTLFLGFAGFAAFLGIQPIFGALIAGIFAAQFKGSAEEARVQITTFGLAFFVPLYFAIVGLRLDLAHHFDPLFFLLFLAVACVSKAGSCYIGARLAGESNRGARNLAVALNARGGPGIVLATTAFDHGVINENFFTILVMLAIVTSVAAGSWLEAVLGRNRDLLSETERVEPKALALG